MIFCIVVKFQLSKRTSLASVVAIKKMESNRNSDLLKYIPAQKRIKANAIHRRLTVRPVHLNPMNNVARKTVWINKDFCRIFSFEREWLSSAIPPTRRAINPVTVEISKPGFF